MEAENIFLATLFSDDVMITGSGGSKKMHMTRPMILKVVNAAMSILTQWIRQYE
jgi:hypothetical protein